MHRNTVIAVTLLLFSVELVSVCDATSGTIIVFEKDNFQNLAGYETDVGHVGVAFQNPDDGTWIAGAVEGPGGANNMLGVNGPANNGGWVSDVGFFKTEEDLVKEFALPRTVGSNGIIPHGAYDRMKVIGVKDSDYKDALSKIQEFPTRGYRAWAKNDCLDAVYDILIKYNVAGLSAPELLEWPKNYFNKLQGDEIISADFLKVINGETGTQSSSLDASEQWFANNAKELALPTSQQQTPPQITPRPAAVAGASNTGIQSAADSQALLDLKIKPLIRQAFDLIQQQKFSCAIKAFDEAISINPNSGIAWCYKGLALHRLGRTIEEGEAVTKANELGYFCDT